MPSASTKAELRAAVLRQCVEAEAAWNEKPGRNLILCFDGTGNILGFGGQTNVIKLMKRLNKQSPFTNGVEQIVYYDPGVGTNNEFPPAGILAKALRRGNRSPILRWAKARSRTSPRDTSSCAGSTCQAIESGSSASRAARSPHARLVGWSTCMG